MSQVSLPPLPGSPDVRFETLDVFRGLAMMLMITEGMGFGSVLETLTQQGEGAVTPFWQAIAYQFDHVPWTGCALWDLIQPSFMFLVGVSVPYSQAAKLARGDSRLSVFAQGLLRAFVFVSLAVLLYSQGAPQTNYVFKNVLAQIGLGFPLLLLLSGTGRAVQALVVAALLGGSWYAFFRHPVMDAAAMTAAGIPTDSGLWFSGFGAHWNNYTNWSAEMDRTILNWFPREMPFVFDQGGYQTLNFVPAAASMLMGLMTGEFLRSEKNVFQKRNRMLLWGMVLLATGLLLDHTLWPESVPTLTAATPAAIEVGPTQPFFSRNFTICPSVKRIWTPMWAVFSTGWVLVLLASIYDIVEIRRIRFWTYPFVAVGSNSIVLYLLASTADHWTVQQLHTHFGEAIFSSTYGPILERLGVTVLFGLLAIWLYRQKLFFRI